MANLIDYVTWRGDLTFESSPFNKIDGLIFSQIAYMLVDGLVTEGFSEPITLNQLFKNFRESPNLKERLEIGFLMNDRTMELVYDCADCQRYKDILVCGFRNIFSEERIEQFAVMTFVAGNDVIVSYRGTDDYVIGLEEDFRIAFEDLIPAQVDGLKYFEEVCQAFPDGTYTLLGHSKGGNLAINTAVLCDNSVKDSIKSILNYDGPGFTLDYFEKPEYQVVKEKITSFYPQSSVVGMLFHHDCNVEIVESTKVAIMQHDVLSWNVKGCNFINRDSLTDDSKFFYKTFNDWIDKVSSEERECFVNSLFSVIKAPGYKTNTELQKNAIQASAKMIAAYNRMDKTEKSQFKDIFFLLINTAKSELPIFKLLNNSPLSNQGLSRVTSKIPVIGGLFQDNR